MHIHIHIHIHISNNIHTYINTRIYIEKGTLSSKTSGYHAAMFEDAQALCDNEELALVTIESHKR